MRRALYLRACCPGVSDDDAIVRGVNYDRLSNCRHYASAIVSAADR